MPATFSTNAPARRPTILGTSEDSGHAPADAQGPFLSFAFALTAIGEAPAAEAAETGALAGVCLPVSSLAVPAAREPRCPMHMLVTKTD